MTERTRGTTLMVTDDEVIAVAAAGGAVWPAPLPTIDQYSAESHTTAVARGLRSLWVRGLLDETPDQASSPAGMLSDLFEASRMPAALAAFTYRDTDRGRLVGQTVVVFESQTRAVVDVASPRGVHRFEATDIQSARMSLLAFAQAAFTEGVDSGGEDTSNGRMAVVQRGGHWSLDISKGRVSTMDADGRQSDSDWNAASGMIIQGLFRADNDEGTIR